MGGEGERLSSERKEKAKKVTGRKNTNFTLINGFRILQSLVQTNDCKYRAAALTASEQLLSNVWRKNVDGSMTRSRFAQCHSFLHWWLVFITV